LRDDARTSDNLTEASGEAAAWQRPLLDLLLALARHRTLLAVTLILGMIVATAQYLLTPAYYRSSADVVLLPREKPTVDFSVLASSVETKEDGARRADSGSLMLPPQPDLYLSLLGSRAVLDHVGIALGDRLIDDSDVRADDRSDELFARLKRMVRITGSDEGMLVVTVTAGTPELAADIANMLIAAGQEASKSIERQLLLQQAGYLSRAVTEARRKLKVEEEVLKQFSAEHSLIHPEMQANDRIREIRDLGAARDRARADLNRRRLHFTDNDPEVQRLVAEIETRERRILELRGTIAGNAGERDYGAIHVEYQAMQQGVRFRRDLLATISTQSDVFRIRAEQPAGNLAVVRSALPIARPAGPSKKKIFGIALAAALFIGVGVALLLEQLAVLQRDPSLSGILLACRRELLRPLKMRRQPKPAEG